MNNQQPLIKDMIPQEKKSVRKQKMLGPYDFYEVTSAFRKDIKLGNKESAIFWLTVFLEFGDKSAIDYVLRQCWIMLAEDMYNPQLSSYCASIISMKKQVYCRETDHLFVLVTEMCDSEKWWEINKGREMIKLWWKAQGDLKNKKYKKKVHQKQRWYL